jgi:hypothetical protein
MDMKTADGPMPQQFKVWGRLGVRPGDSRRPMSAEIPNAIQNFVGIHTVSRSELPPPSRLVKGRYPRGSFHGTADCSYGHDDFDAGVICARQAQRMLVCSALVTDEFCTEESGHDVPRRNEE